MQAIEMAFEGGAIDLAQGVFKRCTFRNCTLLAEGANFLFVGPTRFAGTIRVRTGRNRAIRDRMLSEWRKAEADGKLLFEEY